MLARKVAMELAQVVTFCGCDAIVGATTAPAAMSMKPSLALFARLFVSDGSTLMVSRPSLTVTD